LEAPDAGTDLVRHRIAPMAENVSAGMRNRSPSHQRRSATNLHVRVFP
jgi:hypothetical protein